MGQIITNNRCNVPYMGSERRYRDEKWLSMRVREGRPPAEIAELCDASEKTIERWIGEFEIRPYQDEEWLADQISRYVPASTIAEWCCVTEQTVKRWMKRYEIEHPGLAPASVLKEYLASRFEDPDEVPAKTKINLLTQRYVPRLVNARLAEAVGCTPGYARQVRGEPTTEFGEYLDYAEFSGSESVPEDLKTSILERDGRACVRCGATEDDKLEVHHILPGESTEVNLATLCRTCHKDAHKGDFYTSGFAYESRTDFWENWTET